MDIKTLYNRLVVELSRLKDESGQDLIEYALIVALIAFAAVVGMQDLANGINTAFNTISNTVNTYLNPGGGGS
jgi:pilus assembly protein Flp/PilA